MGVMKLLGDLHVSVSVAFSRQWFLSPTPRLQFPELPNSHSASLSNAMSSSTLLPSVFSPPFSPFHRETPLQMCDYANWRRRGWCRLEMCGAVMSRTNVRLMIIKGGEVAPEFLVPEDALHLLPGLGTYTCCALGHKWGACDKIAGEL